MGAVFLLTTYCAESKMVSMVPEELLPETTRTTLAPLATAVDHSTSREFSVRSSIVQRPLPAVLVQMPGLIPLATTCVNDLMGGRPKALRKVATSLATISLVPAMAMV